MVEQELDLRRNGFVVLAEEKFAGLGDFCAGEIREGVGEAPGVAVVEPLLDGAVIGGGAFFVEELGFEDEVPGFEVLVGGE